MARKKSKEELEREAGGQAFISAREKALSRGAGKQEATQAAITGTEPEIQPKTTQTTVAEKQQQAKEIGIQQRNTLEETGIVKGFPTEQKQLVSPIGTQQGVIEVFDAAQNERVTKRLQRFLDTKQRNLVESFGDEMDVQEKIQLTIIKGLDKVARFTLDVIDNTALVARTAADVTSKVPFIGDIIVSQREEKVQNLQSSLEAKNQMATAIASDVASGTMRQADAFKALDAIERQTNEAEAAIQQQVILSPTLRTSEALEDVQTDILELRQEIFRARTEVFGAGLVEPDPAAIALRIEELKKQ